MSPTGKDPVPTKFVCAGKRLDRGKLVVLLHPYDDLNQERVFKLTKNTRRLIAGGIYLIPAFENSIVPSQAKYEGMYPSADHIVRWVALELAELDEYVARKQEEKDKDRMSLATVLLPLRQAHARLNPLGQAALEARVLRALRRHPIELT